jgi:hypothetical protein
VLKSGNNLVELKHFSLDFEVFPVRKASALPELTIAFWLYKMNLDQKILSFIYLRFPIKGKQEN